MFVSSALINGGNWEYGAVAMEMQQLLKFVCPGVCELVLWWESFVYCSYEENTRSDRSVFAHDLLARNNVTYVDIGVHVGGHSLMVFGGELFIEEQLVTLVTTIKSQCADSSSSPPPGPPHSATTLLPSTRWHAIICAFIKPFSSTVFNIWSLCTHAVLCSCLSGGNKNYQAISLADIMRLRAW
jgi:hypothetical protein